VTFLNQEQIGKYILNLRKKHNLTQSEFASRLNVTSQAVSKWENGRGIPDIELLKKISEEFNVNIDDILNGKRNKKKNYYFFITRILIILIISGITIYFLTRPDSDLNMNWLSSDNTEFKINGIAAFRNDKKSIYISEIQYLNEDNKNEEFKLIECSLYETMGDSQQRISKCTYKNEDEWKVLSELLQSIEFKVDNYDSNCKDYSTHEFYILIELINSENKSYTYKIPLRIEENC